MFTPRLKDDILLGMLARFVASSGVTDVEEGSAPAHIFGTVADEVEGAEYRQAQMQKAWDFEEAFGLDLDDRLGELPNGGVSRLGASAAVTTSLKVTIYDTSAETTIPVGTIYGRSDDPAVQYVQLNEVTVPIGQAEYPGALDAPIDVVATLLGPRGNASVSGVVDRIVSGPDNLLTVINEAAISGGESAEEDAPYKERGRLYLGALAGCQAMALEFVARSFISSDGVHVRFAKAIEDPRRPGYTELVVDDGAGMYFVLPKAATTTGVVPVGDGALIQTVIYHQAPAKEPIGFGQLKRQAGGVGAFESIPLYSNGRPRWISLPERGLLYPDPGVLAPGDGWLIDGYPAYGKPIAELQTKIEGAMANSILFPGKRAAGTRVRVVAPTRQPITSGIEVQVVVLGEIDAAGAAALRETVRAEVVAFVAALAPGAPLFLAALSAKLMALTGVRNVRFNAPADDVYCNTPRHKLYIVAANVGVV